MKEWARRRIVVSIWTIGKGLGPAIGGLLIYASAASGAVPQVPIYNSSLGGSYLRVKPYVITYTGDDTGFLAGQGQASHHPKSGRLRWRAWNDTEALATGADWIDNCLPNCATGLRYPFPVRLELYRPRREGGYGFFTRMRVTYTHNAPTPGRRSLLFRVRYSSSLFTWVGGSIA
jgi:hypothetical protein